MVVIKTIDLVLHYKQKAKNFMPFKNNNRYENYEREIFQIPGYFQPTHSD